jgi:hypothetical protein
MSLKEGNLTIHTNLLGAKIIQWREGNGEGGIDPNNPRESDHILKKGKSTGILENRIHGRKIASPKLFRRPQLLHRESPISRWNFVPRGGYDAMRIRRS